MNTPIRPIRKTERFGTENPEAGAAGAAPRSGGALCQEFTLELGILGGDLLRHLPAFCIQARRQGAVLHRQDLCGQDSGVFHNLGQLLVACLIMSNFKLMSYFAVLLFSGLISGILIGIVAAVLYDKLPHLTQLKDENKLTPGRALAIGFAQIFALVPGVSRSGSTIIAGRVMGLNTRAAANYSMLASIPLMTAVVLKSAISGNSQAYIGANFWPLLWANLAAFVVGLIAVRFLINYAGKSGSLQNFGRYRVIVGGLVLVLGLTLAF